MTKEFEVGFEGTLAATPEECWRAVTVEAGSWSWPIRYEPYSHCSRSTSAACSKAQSVDSM